VGADWREALFLPGRRSARLISSTKVFQPPQDGHLPSHLELSNPQDWQTKLVLGISLFFIYS